MYVTMANISYLQSVAIIAVAVRGRSKSYMNIIVFFLSARFATCSHVSRYAHTAYTGIVQTTSVVERRRKSIIHTDTR